MKEKDKNDQAIARIIGVLATKNLGKELQKFSIDTVARDRFLEKTGIYVCRLDRIPKASYDWYAKTIAANAVQDV